MRVLSGYFLVAGFLLLCIGLLMPLYADDSEDAEFQQMREGISSAGIGAMVGAVACVLLDATRERGGSFPTATAPAPSAQPPAQPPHPPTGPDWRP
jgi:hypothetical protein